ncbi:MAG: hypothetical protein HFJ48_00415 [Clostridia bacterium]|nr:hypothetical protein [Clostridia bacterium]
MRNTRWITWIALIVTIIALLILSGVVIYILNNPQNRLEKQYNIMISNNTYIFSRNSENGENKIVTTKRGDKTRIDMYNSGDFTTTLIKDGNTYLISHGVQEYYIYSNNSIDEEILTEELERIVKKEHKTGREKIYGRTYYYEEFSGITDFLIESYKDMDLNTAKTRFYFKGEELQFIKTIYQTIDSNTGKVTDVEELLKASIEYDVDDKVFEIPSNYAES